MADKAQENQPQAGAVALLERGTREWRVELARQAWGFFQFPHVPAVAALIQKPGKWSVADFMNYIQKIGFPGGTVTAVTRILGAMERAGLLLASDWDSRMPLFGQLYVSLGVDSVQTQGDLWLSEVLGADLIIDSYNPVTVRISRGGHQGSGSGLMLDDSHVVTNRHVVEDLARREVDIIETDLSFKWIGSELVTLQCRVWGHQDMDVAVVKVKDAKPFRRLPGMVFREPNWADEVFVFGYPTVPGTVDEPITVQPGRVVNPGATAAAISGYSQRQCVLFSAISRPGNSGGPVVAHDGRVIGLVEEHPREELSGTADESDTYASPLFYRGIPANEVVRAIEQFGFTNLAVLESPF